MDTISKEKLIIKQKKSPRRAANKEETMKLLIEDDNGTISELREIAGVSSTADVIVFQTCIFCRSEKIKTIEDELTQKIGKKCIILGAEFTKVFSV